MNFFSICRNYDYKIVQILWILRTNAHNITNIFGSKERKEKLLGYFKKYFTGIDIA